MPLFTMRAAERDPLVSEALPAAALIKLAFQEKGNNLSSGKLFCAAALLKLLGAPTG
jgi:hypothetical protein